MVSCALRTTSCRAPLSVPLRILLCRFAVLVFQYHIAAFVQVPSLLQCPVLVVQLAQYYDSGGAAINRRSIKE